MFMLNSFNQNLGIAEIIKSLICKVPGKSKYASYLVNAKTQDDANALVIEANQIGGQAFSQKYGIQVEIIIK